MFRHRFFRCLYKLELPFAYRCGDYFCGLGAGACLRCSWGLCESLSKLYSRLKQELKQGLKQATGTGNNG